MSATMRNHLHGGPADVGRTLAGGGLVFWLGAHHPGWLARAGVPLFVSHRRLAGRRRLPAAACRWALDSGAFSELAQHGRWRTMTATGYADTVARYAAEIGQLAWAAPMDWMCEPFMLARTGLTVREHQDRTVANYLDLVAAAPGLPWVPVLQGWTLTDYLACVDLYRQAGIDLSTLPLVGLGSVCRRQASNDIRAIVTELAGAGLRLHGFGVKTAGLAAYGSTLASADSMAWSFQARRQPPLPGCEHANCANCLRYALHWRADLAARLLWPPPRRTVTKPRRPNPGRPRFVTCQRCRARVDQAPVGRPVRYCGTACRQAARRARTAGAA